MKALRFLIAALAVMTAAAGGYFAIRWAEKIDPNPPPIVGPAADGALDKIIKKFIPPRRGEAIREPDDAAILSSLAGTDRMPLTAEGMLSDLSEQNRTLLREKYNLGLISLSAGDTQAAINAFRAIHEINPQGEFGRWAFQQIGMLHDREGRYEAAIENLRKAVVLDAQDALAAHNLGVALLHAGRATEAVEHLSRASTIEPNNLGILQNLAIALQHSGDADGAYKASLKSLALDSTHPEIRFNTGLFVYRTNDPNRFAEAQDHFEAAAAGLAGVQRARAEAFLGMVQYRRGFHAEAGAAFGRAAAFDPARLDYRFNEAVAYAIAEYGSAAEAAYASVLKSAPRDTQAWFGMAGVLYKTGRRDEALEAYRKGLAVDSMVGNALFTAGYILLEKGEIDRAEEMFRRVIALGGSDAPLAHVNLGLCFESRGKWAEAAMEYEAGDPSDPRTFFNLGLVRRRLGEYERALVAFQKASDMRPKEARFASALADAYLDVGRPDAAVAQYEKAVKNSGEVFDLLIRLANLTAQLERIDESANWAARAMHAAVSGRERALAHVAEAILHDRKGLKDLALESLRKALAEDRSNPDVYYNIGVLYSQQTRYDEAVDALRACIRLKPDHSPAYTQLGNVFYIRGLKQEAAAAYAEALKIDSGATGAAFSRKQAENS